MKQIGKRTILLGVAALCWGIMFPEYTFTADSYTAFVQEAQDIGDADGIGDAGIAAGEDETDDAEELFRAVREGRVRYRFRLYDYFKNLFLSRMENESDGNAFLRRELCAMRGGVGWERGIDYLWSIRDRTDMRRSEYLIPESAG